MPGVSVPKGGEKVYLEIKDGNIVQRVPEGTPDARRRERTTPEGEPLMPVWELVFMNWESKILSVTFKESPYGRECVLELEDALLTLKVNGSYFRDFAQRFAGGDLTKPFVIHPYKMEVEGRNVTGVSLKQDGEKLKNFFYNGESVLHGYPEADQKEKEELGAKSYWPIFFIKVSAWLVNYIKTKMVFPARKDAPAAIDQEAAVKEVFFDEKEVEKEPGIDDLPF